MMTLLIQVTLVLTWIYLSNYAFLIFITWTYMQGYFNPKARRHNISKNGYPKDISKSCYKFQTGFFPTSKLDVQYVWIWGNTKYFGYYILDIISDIQKAFRICYDTRLTQGRLFFTVQGEEGWRREGVNKTIVMGVTEDRTGYQSKLLTICVSEVECPVKRI